MSNLLLAFPNYADNSVLYTPTYSGGSWSGSLPLTNLKDRRLAYVARSASAALTSTIAKVDLAVARSVGLLATPKHTMSSAAMARWRVFAASPILEDNDFNSWTSVGTPTITTAQADPFGGTRATLIGDDDAAAAEAKKKTVTFTGDGTKTIAITLKVGTAAVTDFGIRDDTAGINRHIVRVTWSGGVPTLSSIAGSGTLYTAFNPATGFYELMATVPSVVAANTNAFYLYGAGSTVAATGNTYAYEAMAFDFATQPIVADSGVASSYPSGSPSAEDLNGLNYAHVYIPPAAVTGRYVRLEIADTTNAAGYVDLARIVIARAYTPATNMSYGARLGLESDTVRSVTDGGAALFQTKPIRRTLTFALEHIQESEAFASAWKLQRLAGKSGQIFVVFDQADTTLLHERSFLCTLRELGALEFSQALYNAMGFQLVEEL